MVMIACDYNRDDRLIHFNIVISLQVIETLSGKRLVEYYTFNVKNQLQDCIYWFNITYSVLCLSCIMIWLQYTQCTQKIQCSRKFSNWSLLHVLWESIRQHDSHVHILWNIQQRPISKLQVSFYIKYVMEHPTSPRQLRRMHLHTGLYACCIVVYRFMTPFGIQLYVVRSRSLLLLFSSSTWLRFPIIQPGITCNLTY